MPIIQLSHVWKQLFVTLVSVDNNCTHLKKPSEIIRHSEDEFSKAEMKLSNFPNFDVKRAGQSFGASAGNSE